VSCPVLSEKCCYWADRTVVTTATTGELSIDDVAVLIGPAATATFVSSLNPVYLFS